MCHPHRSLTDIHKDLSLTQDNLRHKPPPRSPGLTTCEVVVNLLPFCRLAEGHGCFGGFHGDAQEPIFHVNPLHRLVQGDVRGRLKGQGQNLDSELVSL